MQSRTRNAFEKDHDLFNFRNFLHNFPEGRAMASGIVDFKPTLTIALAIAIHDIPEAI